MNSYKQPGEVIDWVNGTGSAVASGVLVKIGGRVGVTCVAIANGATGSVRVEGVCEVAKLGTDVVAQGAEVYLDNGNARVTLDDDEGANVVAGYAFAAAGNGATKVLLKLNG